MYLILVIVLFGFVSFCDDDDDDDVVTSYIVTYKANVTGTATLDEVQYDDGTGNMVVEENPGNAFEIELTMDPGDTVKITASGNCLDGKIIVQQIIEIEGMDGIFEFARAETQGLTHCSATTETLTLP
jgi:hypothetical protein